MSQLKRIGEVTRDDGSLALIVADARDASSWGAIGNGDFDRACQAMNQASGSGALGQSIVWSDGKGIFTDLGGAGGADVFRLGPDELLLSAVFAESDWSKATEQAYRDDAATLPAKETTNVGDVVISSGVVALVWAGERAKGITEERLTIARASGAARRPWGLLAALPNGTYDVLFERMDVTATWGIMESRLRIVPHRRAPAVVARGLATTEPKAKSGGAKSKRRTAPPPRHVIELAHDANRVATLTFSSDGKTLAAGGDGLSVAALFRGSDFTRQALFEDIGPTGLDFSKNRYCLNVRVSFDASSESIAIAVGERVEIRRVRTGEVTHRGIHVRTPGGERKMFTQTLPAIPIEQRREPIVALEFDRDGDTPVLLVNGARFPLEEFQADGGGIAELVGSKAARIRPNNFARSPTGSRLLVSHPLRIIDAARAFDEDPEGQIISKVSSSRFAWSPDERLIAFIEDFRPRTLVHDANTGEKVTILKTPSSRIDVGSLSFQPHGMLLALGESDGTVSLFDTKSWRRVLELPNHETKTLDTEARSIGALAWSPDGRWLAVGNGVRGAPGAISIYAADDLAS